MALRFACGLFHRLPVPFPLVTMDGPHSGHLAYASTNELQPGKEPNLDRACRIVLGDEDEIPMPVLGGQVRDHQREFQQVRRWLDELQPAVMAADCGRPTGVAHAVKVHKGLTSLVIPNLNGSDHVRRCLESISKHTKEPHEIIVIDNGSTDGSLEYLRRFEDVTVIENTENVGAPMARNQAVAFTSGDVVVFMDNDVEVTPGWLGRLRKHFGEHPTVGLIGPRSNYVSGPQLIPEANYSDQQELDWFANGVAASNSGRISRTSRLILFCLAVRQEVLQRIGGFDPAYGHWGFEDDDYSLRAQIAGFQLAIAHDVFIHHSGSQTSKTGGIDYGALLNRNWQVFCDKWGIPPDKRQEMVYDANRLVSRQFTVSEHSVRLPAREELGHVAVRVGRRPATA